MQHRWSVCRQTIKRPDASQRWDRAYQNILQWSMETETDSTPSVNGKEDNHASSSIRQSFDSGTGKATDH